ncbi:hypothetical protein ACHWQZ_G001294 [Mnemiopsis leidyi]
MARLFLLLTATLCVIAASVQEEAKLRIYYGEDADKNEFPFTVRLTHPDGDHLCGGALLRPGVVITAAHCVTHGNTPSSPDHIRVVVGDHKATEDEDTEQKFEVARVVCHKKYDYFFLQNDIALLILKNDVKLSEGVQEISLPEDRRLYEAGTPITVIGWGGTHDGDLAEVLQKHEYEISDQEACKEWWKKDQTVQIPISEGMLCTGKPPLKGHAWYGDSGGPLFTRDGDKFVLLALTSWGVVEPDVNAYDVNVDLHYHLSWIQENIAEIEQGKWVELVGRGNSGVVVFQERESDKSYKSYTVCNNGVSQKEATTICAGFGFKYGELRFAREFQPSWKKGSDLPPIGKSGFFCDPEATSAWDCTGTDYPETAEIPCLEGDELAVSCFDNVWDLRVPSIITTELRKLDGYARGLVQCYPYVQLRGSSVDFKNNVEMFLVNVKEEGAELVKRMKFKKKDVFNMHVTRLRPRDKLKHNCLACVAALTGVNSRFFAAKVEMGNCKMDREAALQIVNEWARKRNEIN